MKYYSQESSVVRLSQEWKGSDCKIKKFFEYQMKYYSQERSVVKLSQEWKGSEFKI